MGYLLLQQTKIMKTLYSSLEIEVTVYQIRTVAKADFGTATP